jgi:hypothetical protein
MRRFSTITILTAAVFAFLAMTVGVQGSNAPGEVLEYEVISIDPGNWIVTAREVASGEEVKFRLPPTAFKGQTFDGNLEEVQPGHRFSVRGPRNARLNQLIVEQSIPEAPNRGPGLRAKFGRQPGGSSETLGWEIINVDPRKWIVTAKNRQSHKTAKFQVHPEAFIGFHFKANLRGISKGEGFSLVTPNDQPMSNSCTLLEREK